MHRKFPDDDLARNYFFLARASPGLVLVGEPGIEGGGPELDLLAHVDGRLADVEKTNAPPDDRPSIVLAVLTKSNRMKNETAAAMATTQNSNQGCRSRSNKTETITD